MIDSHRYLNLTNEQIKNLFKTEAKSFAKPKELGRFKHFNITSYYIIPKILTHKSYYTYEEAEEFLLTKPCYKDYKIEKKYVLLMGR